MYLIQIQVDKPRNLLNLLGEKMNSWDKNELEFHFKYSLFGKQIKTNDFYDIHCADFKKHKFLFPILTYDKNMLRDYFESYPTIEIRFCARATVIGFVTINLLRLFENNFTAIEGDYMVSLLCESVFLLWTTAISRSVLSDDN